MSSEIPSDQIKILQSGGIFLLLVDLITRKMKMSLNRVMFLKINGLAGKYPLLDKMTVFLAQYAIFMVPIFLLYLWFKKSEETDEIKKKALLLFTAAMISWFFSFIISSVYFHPRPFMLQPPLGKKLISHAPDASFPSDHTTVLSALAFTYFFSGEVFEGTIFLILAFIVGFARVYCGIHFPYDIFGGVAAGLMGAGLTTRFKKQLSPVFDWCIHLWLRILRIVLK